MEEIQKQLFELQDMAYRDFHSRLMPGIDKETIIGIRVPVLRKYAKSIAGTELSEKFIKELWNHRPITDFWQISTGTEERLKKFGVTDMQGITETDENLLYKEFGKNAEILIDHAWGRESCLMQDIKNYKKLSEQEQDKLKILLLIFLAPVILLFLDYYNIFSKLFPQYGNLSREYDWLSFIGTYAGTIVSSILLIFITEKDRNENTAVLRTSQRPYLDISYMKIDSKFFKENKDNVTTFDHGKNSDKTLEKDEYLTLCIKNNGAIQEPILKNTYI